MGEIMGCCQSPPTYDHALSEEENAIVTCEANLHYGRYSASRIARVIAENSTDEKITENQFNTIVEALDLNIAELDSVDSAMAKFYRKLKVKSNYEQAKMMLLAAMLGTGPPREKVGIVFSQLPSKEGGLATVTSVNWLLDALFLLAVKSLPVLAIGEQPLLGRVLTQEQGTTYIEKMNANLQNAKTAALQAILKGRGKVSQDDLLSAFDASGPLSNFLRPITIRTFVLRPEFNPK